jgi:hypothetical protein
MSVGMSTRASDVAVLETKTGNSPEGDLMTLDSRAKAFECVDDEIDKTHFADFSSQFPRGPPTLTPISSLDEDYLISK